MDRDNQILDLLGICHYVLGGLTLLFSSFFLIYVLLGIGLATGQFNNPDAVSRFFGGLFAGIGILSIIVAWVLGILILVAGRKLRRHVSYGFCLTVAVLECLLMPFGTVLGIATIVVLMLGPIRDLFGVNHST